MKKYITLILGCLLMAACKQEVLEPGQMIQGRFALDEGIGLTDEFLHFDKGHLSIYWATTPYPFAEGKIWCCQNKDVFYLAFSSGYSITDGWLNSPRLTGPIELKDGKLSIGDRIYYTLESFEGEPYSSVSVINKIICPYVERDISIPYTINHPIPSGSLQCSTETDWITDLAVQNGEITAHLSATSSNRDGAISVSYPYVDPIIITVEQRPFTFIRLEEETRTVDYTAQNVVLPYTIDNPVSGSSLTAQTDASWINNIQVSDNEVSFNVAENNPPGGARSATITLKYKGAKNMTYSVIQQCSVVDMGFGVLWASCNLGASNPEEYGDYYAWGEVEPYYTEGHGQDDPCMSWRTGKTGYNWNSYKWCIYDTSLIITKYCTASSYGYVDNIRELQRGEGLGETVDDAARAILGNKWRMPTILELEGLNECDMEWVIYNGVLGCKYISMKDASKWIFLPAAGYRQGSSQYVFVGSRGWYWSSSLYTRDNPSAASSWSVTSNGGQVGGRLRCFGLSVRPVYENEL